MVVERIDSHQHFFKPGRIQYRWMTPEMPIAKDFLPQDLKPILERNGISRTILVQAADQESENHFLFELAAKWDFIAGVVIWLDMEEDEFEEKLVQYSERSKFCGVRPMIESIADDRWMLRPAVKRAFAVIEENNIGFDFLTHPRHLPHVIEILSEFPRLRAVIDHISKPRIRDREMQPWATQMEKVASHTNVFCKLSGMITEADHLAWRPDDLEPYIRHIVEIFGYDRLMFGSDWPVCLLAGSYEEVLAALNHSLTGLTEQQMAEVFGGTAKRFYRI
jgi:L-fuconolactonase